MSAALLADGSAGVSDIDTDGSVVSTNHVYEADALFPALSVAVAVIVCEPSARPVAPAQPAAAPPSSLVVLLRPQPPSPDVTVVISSALLLGAFGRETDIYGAGVLATTD